MCKASAFLVVFFLCGKAHISQKLEDPGMLGQIIFPPVGLNIN